MTRRQERVSEQIHRVLSELLTFEMQDPRLANITLSRAEITGDLHHATAYVLPHGSEQEMKQDLDALRHAQGFLRRQLAERLQLRFAPDLSFELDEQSAQEERLQKLLDELKE